MKVKNTAIVFALSCLLLLARLSFACGPSMEAIIIVTPEGSVIEGTQLMFDGSDSIDTFSGVIGEYRWDFDDGSGYVYGDVVNHTYTSSGTYNVTLRITDGTWPFTDTTQVEVCVLDDCDDDGMPDDWEIQYTGMQSCVDDASGDLDSDGLTNLDEYLEGTNPKDTDSDDDGMWDGFEVDEDLDPLDFRDADEDRDEDDYSNLSDYLHNRKDIDDPCYYPDPCDNIIIEIPGNAYSIQSAILASIDGDTIEVQPGEYFESIDILGRDITLQSADPDNPSVVAGTLICGKALLPTIALAGTETSACHIKGLTITHGISSENLEAHWLMDDGTGNTASDSTGNHDGSLISYPPGDSQWITGLDKGALEFDGVNDYVGVTGYEGVTGTGSRTVSAWIKTDQVGIIAAWGVWEGAGTKWQFFVQDYNGTAGAIRVSVAGGYIVGSTDVRDNQWHHVAAVLEDDGSPMSSEIKLYVDGVR